MASTYSLQHKRERHTIHTVQDHVLREQIGRGYFLQILIVFSVYLIAGRLGQATANIRSSNLGPVWPAYGVALAAILICGYRSWLGVAAGAFVVAFFSPVSHLGAFGQASGTTIAAVAGAFFLFRVANFQRSLSRLSDAISLIVFGAFGSAMVSASLGVSALYVTHVHAYSGLGSAWLIYWLGDATGVLLVAPLALRFSDLLQIGERRRLTELALLLMLLAATCFVIFGDLPSIPVKMHVLAFVLLPFIIWAAIRFGLGVTALSILIVASIATVETALGSGPFASNTAFVNGLLLDVFFGVLSVSGLSLAAVIAEREVAEREREQVVSKQAALEARLRVDDELRESEERLRLAVRVGRMYAYTWDVETDELVRSKEHTDILGLTEQAERLSRQRLLEKVHPDDRAKFNAADNATPECPNTQVSYRVLRPDGSVVWLQKNARAFFDSKGKMLRMTGIVADVTDQKLAEESLAGMTRKLIEAQEQERARIARELHDDINQRLAMLAVELDQLRDNPSDFKNRVKELHRAMAEISDDVQGLSHELHSSKLAYLGVVSGIKSWCKEFAARHKMEIDFKSEVSSALPLNVGLSLFRILQESMHNALKHSGVKRVEVELRDDSGEIHLVIRDLGKGFDLEGALQGKGLGLTSMRERVRLLGGTIGIESKPMGGTIIHVRVPLEPGSGSQRVAV